MTKRFSDGTARSGATHELLKLALEDGYALLSAVTGAGFIFRVTTRGGAVFEGEPAHSCLEDVGHVLILGDSTYVLAHEIAAIEVVQVG